MCPETLKLNGTHLSSFTKTSSYFQLLSRIVGSLKEVSLCSKGLGLMICNQNLLLWEKEILTSIVGYEAIFKRKTVFVRRGPHLRMTSIGRELHQKTTSVQGWPRSEHDIRSICIKWWPATKDDLQQKKIDIWKQPASKHFKMAFPLMWL